MEVCDIVQGAVIKTIPKKKKCKKTKWFSEEASQIAEKRREAKGKGEKERNTHLNQSSKEQQEEVRTSFSVITAKKQRKTIEWERLEISSRKLDTKGTIHVKMGTIKEKNSMDLTEAEDIKKRWQEYTEETLQV